MNRKRVMHVITSTGVGGAENMLYKYLSNTNQDLIEHYVISLVGIDNFGLKIKQLNIPIHGLSKPIYTLKGVRELYKVTKEFDPDILQSWLYHSDLVCLVLKLFLNIKLCWNIRSYKVYKFQKLTGLLVKFLALFSKVPDVILINSLASKDYHQKIWYRPKRWEYIPNGFDPSVFKIRSEIKSDFRDKLNIDPKDYVIGMVSRYSSDKDHDTFLRACSLIFKQRPNTHFVMVGANVDSCNSKLMELINELDIYQNVHLLGVRTDIHLIMPCFDIVCSSSLDEAFPNVIGEAMSAAVPCVVTDVGDCALLVGDTGRIVLSGSPEHMSAACLDLLELPKEELDHLGIKARNRILQEFSIQKISVKYDSIYLGL